ncbi:hypothetical protein TeGR_g8779, partial [Tetraparma gracilis]
PSPYPPPGGIADNTTGVIDSPALAILCALGETWFLLDCLAIKWRIGFRDSHADVEMSKAKIASHYWKGDFKWDLVRSIPFDTLFSLLVLAGASENVRDAVLLLSMIKVTRMFDAIQWQRNGHVRSLENMRIKKQVHGHIFSVVRWLVALVIFLHLLACSYWRAYLFVHSRYYLADVPLGESLDYDPDCEEENGVYRYVGNATGHLKTCTADISWRPVAEAVLDQDERNTLNPWRSYAYSFYWAMLVFNGNDVNPTNVTESLFSAIMLFIGIFFFAVVIAKTSTLILSVDAAEEARSKQLSSVNQFLAYRDVPVQLQHKIQSYYNYLWRSGQSQYHKNAFDELPPMLALQLSLCMKRQMIEDSAVFHNLSAASIVAIMDRLVSEIALPDEIVVLQGTTGDRMFFIAQGTVEVRVGVEEEEEGGGEEFEGWVALKQLHRGEAFGEMALMDPDNNRRTCTIVSLTFSELETLQTDDVDDLVEDYSDIGENFNVMWHARENLNANANEGELGELKEGGEEDYDSEEDDECMSPDNLGDLPNVPSLQSSASEPTTTKERGVATSKSRGITAMVQKSAAPAHLATERANEERGASPAAVDMDKLVTQSMNGRNAAADLFGSGSSKDIDKLIWGNKTMSAKKGKGKGQNKKEFQDQLEGM